MYNIISIIILASLTFFSLVITKSYQHTNNELNTTIAHNNKTIKRLTEERDNAVKQISRSYNNGVYHTISNCRNVANKQYEGYDSYQINQLCNKINILSNNE